MNAIKISFTSVMNKYFLYADAVTQFNQLRQDDRQIIAHYIELLKRAWQEELEDLKRQNYIPKEIIILK